MRNYIEFKYDKHGHITAEICRDGKQKTIRSKPNLLKLAEIVESYGYTVDREMKVVRYAREISKDYEKFKKKQRRIQIYNNIQENMKLIKGFVNTKASIEKKVRVNANWTKII